MKLKIEHVDKHTGIHLPVEMIETLRKSHLGIIPTQETRKKMRIANSGENNGFFGHKHSEEFKESRRGKKNPRYGKTPSHGKKYPYDSPLQGRIYLNNSWEAVENPRILTPIEAYEISLNTLKTFENKWDAYVKEEARLLSVFDEDED